MKPIQCFFEIEHPEAPEYKEFLRISRLEGAPPHPPLIVNFTLNSLPDVGDELNVNVAGREGRFLIRKRVFFVVPGAAADDVSVKFEIA
jgi:hypothetical protein